MRKKLSWDNVQPDFPTAVPYLVRLPDRSLRYWFWTRWADAHAGRRDRGPVEDNRERRGVPVADTPWLDRLLAEYANRAGAERHYDDTMIGQLDHLHARLAEQAAILDEQLERKVAERKARQEAGPQQGRRTTAEKFAGTDEIQMRRGREHREGITALDAEIERLGAAQQELRVRIAQVLRDRESHEAIRDDRVLKLREHYHRRAATYVRALGRPRRGQVFAVPTFGIPDWVSREPLALIRTSTAVTARLHSLPTG